MIDEYQEQPFEPEDSLGQSGSHHHTPKVQKKTSEIALPPLNMRNSQASAVESSKSLPKKGKGGQSLVKLPPGNLSNSRSKELHRSKQSSVDSAKRKRIQSRTKLNKKDDSLRNESSLHQKSSPNSSQMLNSQVQNKLVLRVRSQTQSEKAEQYFCQSREELSGLSIDELNRLNQRAKQAILRINQELSVKVNELLLEKKLADRQQKTKTVEETIKLLNGQMSNNEAKLQTQQTEMGKLEGKSSSYHSGDYEYELQNEIIRVTETIKQERRNILKLRKQEKLGEIKILSDDKGERSQHIIEELKSQLFLVRNQDQSNEEKMKELQDKLQSAANKEREEEYNLESRLEEAKDMNLYFDRESLSKKYKQMRAKSEKASSHNMNLRNISKRQAQRHSLQNRHLRNEIKNYQRDIESKASKISTFIEQSLQIIKKMDPSLYEGTSAAQSVMHFRQQSQPHSNIPMSPLKRREKPHPTPSNSSVLKKQSGLKQGQGQQLEPGIQPVNQFMREDEGDMQSIVDTARRELAQVAATKQSDQPGSQTANISEGQLLEGSLQMEAEAHNNDHNQ